MNKVQRIPQDVIETIRQQTNIVTIVEQSVQLKKSGKNYFGLCPFHDEKTPSFSVAEDKQIYYCFGCGKGGNVFQFIQDLDGVTFPEAVQKVADLANVSLDYQFQTGPRESVPVNSLTTELLQIHEEACQLYHHILVNTEVGSEALAYLKQRGLTEEQILEQEIGYAPNERNLLKQVLENKGMSQQGLVESGLMIETKTGELFDRFFNRIIFPIRNDQGKPIAFSGRLFDQQIADKRAPKYLNSPETKLFNKRQVLYNFSYARAHARKLNDLFLFEGFMDVLAANRANVLAGVASMGTSLTNEQIQKIAKIVDQVTICYDGDQAGIEATKRSIETFQTQTKLKVNVLRLPEKLDPDDYIKKYGETAFYELATHHKETAMNFWLFYYELDKNLTNELDQLKYIDEVLMELAKLNSVIEREMYLKQLADRFHLSIESLQETLQQKKQALRRHDKQTRGQVQVSLNEEVNHPISQPVYVEKTKMTLGEKAEQRLLYRILNEPSVAMQMTQEPDFSFMHDTYQEIFTHFQDYMLTHTEYEEADFINYVKEAELKQKIIEIAYLDIPETSSELELQDYLKEIRLEQLRQRKNQLIDSQKEAKRYGNQEQELEIALELINIQKQLNQQSLQN